MDPRTGIALTLVVLLAGGAWWISQAAPESSGSGNYFVVVVAPDGSVFAQGAVDVVRASALSVLEALSQQSNFSLNIQQMAGFSGCSSAYVVGIGPFEEGATGGWNYYTRQPGGDWIWQNLGAGCGLPAGVDVEWCWVENDVCSHHAI